MMTAPACPSCGEKLDAALGAYVEGEKPKPPGPGDLTMCAYCHAILAFTDDLRFRAATAEEIADLDPALRAWLRHVSDHRPPRH
jgi:hypothetical protein